MQFVSIEMMNNKDTKLYAGMMESRIIRDRWYLVIIVQNGIIMIVLD